MANTSVIFGPDNACLALQPGIKFGPSGSRILSGTVDPSSVATTGNIGSLYLNTSSGSIYRKTDNGLSTNWSALPTSTGSGGFDPSTTLQFYEEFTTGGYFGSGEISSENQWSSSATGSPSFTAAGATVPSDTNHPGVLQITVTALNEGGGLLGGIFGSTINRPFFTGGGVLTYESLVYVNAISNGTDNSNIYSGIGNEPAWNALSNVMYVAYNSATSANWIFLSTKASSTTTTTSSIPVTTGWHKLKFIVNAAGTSIEFFIDGVSGGTCATNIPVIALPAYTSFRKVLGTGAMYMGIDYIKIDKTFTTPR